MNLAEPDGVNIVHVNILTGDNIVLCSPHFCCTCSVFLPFVLFVVWSSRGGWPLKCGGTSAEEPLTQSKPSPSVSSYQPQEPPSKSHSEAEEREVGESGPDHKISLRRWSVLGYRDRFPFFTVSTFKSTSMGSSRHAFRCLQFHKHSIYQLQEVV